MLRWTSSASRAQSTSSKRRNELGAATIDDLMRKKDNLCLPAARRSTEGRKPG